MTQIQWESYISTNFRDSALPNLVETLAYVDLVQENELPGYVEFVRSLAGFDFGVSEDTIAQDGAYQIVRYISSRSEYTLQPGQSMASDPSWASASRLSHQIGRVAASYKSDQAESADDRLIFSYPVYTRLFSSGDTLNSASKIRGWVLASVKLSDLTMGLDTEQLRPVFRVGADSSPSPDNTAISANSAQELLEGSDVSIVWEHSSAGADSYNQSIVEQLAASGVIVILTTVGFFNLLVSHFRRASDLLTIANSRFELANLASQDGIWDFDPVAGSVFRSARFNELLNYFGDCEPDFFEWLLGVVHKDDVESVKSVSRAAIIG